MKNFNTILLSAALFVVMTFTSCEKRQVLNRLEGDWEVTSFITDGEEEMGNYYISFNMEYEEADDDEGDVTWTFVDIFGDTETLSGEYEINDDADEIEIVFRDGSSAFIIDADIDNIDKEELELEGFLDGDSFSIRADKD